MLDLDYWSQYNRWRTVSIPEKAFLFLGGLIFALALKNPWALLSLFAGMHALMIFGAGIPIRVLLKLWMAPLVFIGISMITVAISVGSDPSRFVAAVSIGSGYIGFTPEGLMLSKGLFLRVIAALSCLFGLATTTPAAYGAAWFSRNRYLRSISEIALLTYRFIFVVFESSQQIYKAQQSRLGYQDYSLMIRSLSLLGANLGRKSFWSVREIYLALISRGYEERLSYRYPNYPISYFRLAGIFLAWCILGTWAIY